MATLLGALVSIPSAPAPLQTITHLPGEGQRLPEGNPSGNTQGSVLPRCVTLDDNNHHS